LRSSAIIHNDTGDQCNFVVPTGNFGNVYAAYIAKQLGAPIDKLVISSNDNDVLPRLFDTGRMHGKKTVKTISPSMDIQVSSNFERLLWHIKQHNTDAVEQAQQALESAEGYSLSDHEMSFLSDDFLAHRCEESDALKTMKHIWQQHQKMICPHTATAFHAVQEMADKFSGQTVVAETAHPAKFADAVERAIGVTPSVPDHVKDQMARSESFVQVKPAEVQSAIDHRFGNTA
ncbi:MAG: threonine synthase, partial [Pseudomonadota bacterium]